MKRLSMFQITIQMWVLFGLLAFVPPLASGTTYYVSCTGSDSNNGTSTSTPWATLSKASSQAYLPGDQVLLLDGCVWIGTFQPTTSGSSGNPITLSNYGSGAIRKCDGIARRSRGGRLE